MSVSTSPFEPIPNSQYDADSAPNQDYNCGPTTVTNVLKFHQDRDYGIEATRNLATSANYRGTTISERKLMLDKRGTSAEIVHLSHADVKATLNGRRTMDIALLMSKIPLDIRVRPFTGSHSVEGLMSGFAMCSIHERKEPGIWVANPDFHADRGQRSKYFYPDHAWQPAYDALGGWCVRPVKEKVFSTRTSWKYRYRTDAQLHARSGPGTSYTTIKLLSKGFLFSSLQKETKGGAYTGSDGAKRTDWLSFSLSGRVVWVALGYCIRVY